MSKNWEVELTYVVTVAVEDCETEDEAFEWAQNELVLASDLELDQGMAREVKDKDDWDIVCRHAASVARP